MGIIKSHSKLLYNTDNAQFLQFFYNLVITIAGQVTSIPQLTGLWNAIKNGTQRLDDSFKWPAKSPDTRKLVALDLQRVGLLTMIFNPIKDAAKYAVDPDVKESAETLLDQVENYSDTKELAYEGKTSMITNFVQELEKLENNIHITRLGVAANLATLKAKNSEFEQLYITRSEVQYTHTVTGTTTKLRVQLVTAFNNFVTALEGLLLMETDPAVIGELNVIALKINAEIVKATAVLDRHLGITASGNSNNTQTPDITNPAPPNIPPQPPSNTPPGTGPVDPNEHPPAGE
ncbi:MAG: DUF6261 family protein [Tannerellaceae bacterium]|jgi:hypothetical protein|nr:DUF6261 family protein [Tannerellaceae bacterium]